MSQTGSERHNTQSPHMETQQIPSNKRIGDDEEPTKLKKFSFNISMDNLRPFLGQDNRTHRKKKNYKELSTERLTRQEWEGRCVTEGALTKSRSDLSPDLPRQTSNCILQQIEKRGLHCAWQEGNEALLHEVEADNDEQLSAVEWSSGGVASGDLSFVGTPRQAPSSFRAKIKQISLGSTQQVQVCHTSPQFYMHYQPYFDYSYSFYQRAQSQQQYYAINPQLLAHDLRTTLMIKNIPNKYTIRFLSQEIDQSHNNSYDFLYLPYDMKNNCNVGYGFINFISIEALSHFYHAFQNKKWNKFHSQKICHLTYARLQGLSALIDHFQNSKVLTAKDKKYQPIIREFSKIESLLKQQKQKTNNQF